MVNKLIDDKFTHLLYTFLYLCYIRCTFKKIMGKSNHLKNIDKLIFQS